MQDLRRSRPAHGRETWDGPRVDVEGKVFGRWLFFVGADFFLDKKVEKVGRGPLVCLCNIFKKI